ncbi:MAG: hypothetical protein Q9M14_09270 [Mariprofundaceae bacterium]|nr:hypothetical protein [Mariprofundaceae bacterium]
MLNLYKCLLLCCMIILPLQAQAADTAAQKVYQVALHKVVEGKPLQAIAALQAGSALLPKEAIWRERMQAAAILLRMQHQQSSALSFEHNNYLNLALSYIKANPKPAVDQVWPVALLATVLPGAGHAWLGRWHDALVAAGLVWPLLMLTLWAAYRRMGPVTVFFALLSLWLWSGTVFSAVSLAERGSFELYMQWWQSLWQASALPGRPW